MPRLVRSRVAWSRLAFVFLAVALITALAWQLGILETLGDGAATLLLWLESVARDSGFWGVVAFLALAILSVTLGPFTSAPLVPVAVLAWGRWWTFLLLFSGWMVGNVAAYAIGRWGGTRLLHRFITREQVDEWKRRLPQRRALVVLLIARITMPSEVGYAFGVLRIPLGLFLLLSIVAEVPTAAILVFGSEALIHGDTRTLATLVGAAIGLLALAWLFRSVRQHQHEPQP